MLKSIPVMVTGALLLVSSFSWAAHPLITDDAGTLGKGKFQIEISGQHDSDKEIVNGVDTKWTGSQLATTLSYGFIENADLVLALPYQWGKTTEDGVTTYQEQGIADVTLDLKWRFFEQNGFSLALKPGLRFPTGNEEKGLGAGRLGYQAFLIGSREIALWAFHASIGYILNENKADAERNIWHASFAATYEVIKDLKVVGNIGIERNRDKSATKDPAFVLGGFIYSLFDNLDVDFGVKYGLNSVETDWSLMVGAAFRF